MLSKWRNSIPWLFICQNSCVEHATNHSNSSISSWKWFPSQVTLTWQKPGILVTRNRWHAQSRKNTKKKHVARGYIRTPSNASRAHSLNILTKLWSEIDLKGKRLQKLEDNENNAINLCRSSYDKDQETNVITFLAADFKVQGRLCDLVDYKKASQERNPSYLLPSFASEKSHYHKISSPW